MSPPYSTIIHWGAVGNPDNVPVPIDFEALDAAQGQIPMGKAKTSVLPHSTMAQDAAATPLVTRSDTSRPAEKAKPKEKEEYVKDPWIWAAQPNSTKPEIITPGLDWERVCRMNDLNIAAVYSYSEVTSGFGMSCKLADVRRMPKVLTAKFPSTQKASRQQKKIPDFAFLCKPKSENYDDLWFLLTDFDAQTGAPGASKRVIQHPILPFPASRYVHDRPRHDRINWSAFFVAWTSIILGTLFLFLLVAMWYLLRAAKRLKQKINHGPTSAPPPAPRVQEEVVPVEAAN